MSSPHDDLAGRITALEDEVARLRREIALNTSDSTSARALAAGADRDVSSMRAALRAHNTVLQALRQTQLEQGQDIVSLRTEMLGELAAVRTEMQDGFATVRTENQDGFATVRTENQDGFAAVRTEMQDGFATVRTEMQTAFATVHSGMTQIVGLLERIGPEQA